MQAPRVSVRELLATRLANANETAFLSELRSTRPTDVRRAVANGRRGEERHNDSSAPISEKPDILAKTRVAHAMLSNPSNPFNGEIIMASAAIAFFVLALIAGFLGFWGLAASAAGIAKVLLVVFLILAVVSMVAGRRNVAA